MPNNKQVMFGAERALLSSTRVVKVTKAAKAKALAAKLPEPTDRQVPMVYPSFESASEVASFFRDLWLAAEKKLAGSGQTILVDMLASEFEEATAASIKADNDLAAYELSLITAADEKGETVSKVTARIVALTHEIFELKNLADAKAWGPGTQFMDEAALKFASNTKFVELSTLFRRKTELEEEADKRAKAAADKKAKEEAAAAPVVAPVVG